MSELKWSAEAPTVPGVYWWFFEGNGEAMPVEIDHDRDERDRARAERPGAPLFQYEPGIERSARVTKKLGQWMGPIARPDAPVEQDPLT